jgi:hypothetical protein
MDIVERHWACEATNDIGFIFTLLCKSHFYCIDVYKLLDCLVRLYIKISSHVNQ